MIELSEELLLRMYYKMNQARYFEEKLEELAAKGQVHGTIHLAIGQEASGVMPCLALEEGDLASLSHRGHAQAIGFGLDVNLMMAECLGKYTGYSKGKGGSMHIADVENGNLGGNGVVGGGFNLSCGAALTQKYKKTGKVVLCFAGDGATNEGSFHESLNLASIWKLPVVFFIENNQYGMSNPVENHINIENISDRSEAYNMPGLTIDGNDFLDVYNTATKALRYARAGKGPVLIEAKTYRYSGHSKSDKQVYRDKREVLEWQKKDPLLKIKEYLRENRVFTEKQILKMEDEARVSIEQAVAFAKKSPQPQLNTVLEDVYA
ncbi:thiamine pyrophosphate-dependent dehydrogenase E1 component subunit alpha [Acetobacterium carbinolicum]|uniref:thiamine pyrophosphate-dependent dehydrogenase E1 component subunit alpha n=1 Tax=Acetobacterium TaxID=33951 RepID=UPI000DBEC668|nr:MULTISPECIES: thiamine pyrophosphate-dependent dehydrogenase E1 component subunit alpha [unclassified Acetobacterium]AWW26798.1 pyruvate dehydrogenase [Acetobacterium sp. KB-1]MDK2941921.1 acetoin:2,6-dichlorophenolindophenol oxidoreductase subunit alpha [Acetobacterium sp.]MDZ5725204.1 thiamine pyrophosphate-dependent dehydrogenase E1 component subunit alpha [Acetobacterium sp. K1/6]